METRNRQNQGFDLLHKLRLTVPMYAYSRSLLAFRASLPAGEKARNRQKSRRHNRIHGYLYKNFRKMPCAYFIMLKLGLFY